MVEMTETANILNNATDRSLVLMDEIGRGTSTFDGLSLAWACATHLATQVQAFTLFATHYFEITELPQTHSNVANVHLNATEHNDNIVFLHNIQEGAASKSYGLQVAKLAGIPAPVVALAQQQLNMLEAQQSTKVTPETTEQTSTTTEQSPAPATTENPQQSDMFGGSAPHPAVDALDELEPDNLTPRQALEQLYRLKALAET